MYFFTVLNLSYLRTNKTGMIQTSIYFLAIGKEYFVFNESYLYFPILYIMIENESLSLG